MSYCKQEGKDKLIFVTEEDHTLPDDQVEQLEEEVGGIILPNGDINWDCPCLGGMADGPCGEKFKTAFSCFYFSEEEEKGIDCVEYFRDMYECQKKFEEIYPSVAALSKESNEEEQQTEEQKTEQQTEEQQQQQQQQTEQQTEEQQQIEQQQEQMEQQRQTEEQQQTEVQQQIGHQQTEEVKL